MKRILFLLLLPAAIWAQPGAANCYQQHHSAGLDLMSNRAYGDAISEFVAALVICKDIPADNDLSRLIEESKRRWEADLQKSVNEAQKAWKDALASRDSVLTAKKAEAQARKIAEENAFKAYQRGIKAESFRLALLADMARGQGKKSDAFLLAWLGWQLSDTVPPFVRRAFGEAVRDSFSRVAFRASAPVRSAKFYAAGQKILLQTGERRYFSISMEGQATQLPERYQHVVGNPSGDQLVAWGEGNDFGLLNSNGSEIQIKGHSDGIRQVVFSPDGKKILSASRDNSARLWDINGKLLAVLADHGGNVQQAAFSPDGRLIVTRSSDGDCRAWDADGQLLGKVGDGSRYAYRFVLSSGNYIFLQYSDKTVGVYRNSALSLPVETLSGVERMEVAPSGAFVLARTGAHTLSVLGMDGKRHGTIETPSDLKGFCFASGGAHVLTWGDDHSILLWNLSGNFLQLFNGHHNSITSADYLANKQMLLSSSGDGAAKLWDKEGHVVTEWLYGARQSPLAQFNPSGDGILSVQDNGRAVVLSPLPQEVYDRTDKRVLLGSAELEVARKTYQIQFLDTVKGEE